MNKARELAQKLRQYADLIEDELVLGRPREIGDASDCASPLMRRAADALAAPSSAREVEALTEEAMYALIEEHLGLKRYRNNCVINNGTGRWTDAERYFELMRAALRTALAARKEGL